jgi:hypothetical protein
MIQKAILRVQLPGFCVLPFFALLLAFARYSYRGKELLVCWLFFCSLFAALALIFLGAAFTFHAGKNLVKMLGVARKRAPKLALYPAQLLQQAISAPRIIAAGVPKTPAGFSDSVDMLDTHSCLLIHDVTSYEENVRK